MTCYEILRHSFGHRTERKLHMNLEKAVQWACDDLYLTYMKGFATFEPNKLKEMGFKNEVNFEEEKEALKSQLLSKGSCQGPGYTFYKLNILEIEE